MSIVQGGSPEYGFFSRSDVFLGEIARLTYAGRVAIIGLKLRSLDDGGVDGRRLCRGREPVPSLYAMPTSIDEAGRSLVNAAISSICAIYSRCRSVGGCGRPFRGNRADRSY